MVKLGLTTLLLVILRVALTIAVVLGGAAALTHYVALPEPLGTLTWVIAGGFSAYMLLGLALIIGALVVASQQNPVVDSAVRAPKRRRRR